MTLFNTHVFLTMWKSLTFTRQVWSMHDYCDHWGVWINIDQHLLLMFVCPLYFIHAFLFSSFIFTDWHSFVRFFLWFIMVWKLIILFFLQWFCNLIPTHVNMFFYCYPELISSGPTLIKHNSPLNTLLSMLTSSEMLVPGYDEWNTH